MDTRPRFIAINSVDELRRINDEAGGYFFSPDAIKFFGTRLPDQRIYDGRFFITHERNAPNDVGGKYYLRSFEIIYESGQYRIDFRTIGNFRTLRAARTYAKELERYDVLDRVGESYEDSTY